MTHEKYINFVDFVEETYFNLRDSGKDDWEQEFFNAIDDKYTTDEQEPMAHIFYHDDDQYGEVAQGILDDLMGRTLYRAVCFDDESQDSTIYVAIISKKDEKWD